MFKSIWGRNGRTISAILPAGYSSLESHFSTKMRVSNSIIKNLGLILFISLLKEICLIIETGISLKQVE